MVWGLPRFGKVPTGCDGMPLEAMVRVVPDTSMATRGEPAVSFAGTSATAARSVAV